MKLYEALIFLIYNNVLLIKHDHGLDFSIKVFQQKLEYIALNSNSLNNIFILLL